MSKLDQLRALRESQFSSPAKPRSRPAEAGLEAQREKPREQTPAAKILEGLTETLAVAKGEAEPHRVTHHCPTCGQRLPDKPQGFDKKAYQREYMRKRRAAAKRS